MRELAATEGVDLAREMDRMRDWALGKERPVLRSDWQAVARNWIRKAADDIKARGRPPPGRTVQNFDINAPWMKAGSS